jgi:hypothetical protein
MESNLLFDLTTDEDAKNADSLLVRLGWILPIALFSGPLGFAAAPTTRKDVTPLNRKPGGLMEQSNASLQRGDQG